MFVADILMALAVALLLTVLFAAVLGSTGPWDGYWIFFIVILLVAWAAGVWFRPFGPTLWGVYWAPFLLFGLIAALIIAAATPPNEPEARRRTVRRTDGARVEETRVEAPVAEEEDLRAADATAAAVGALFWVLLLVLVVAVVLAYFY